MNTKQHDAGLQEPNLAKASSQVRELFEIDDGYRQAVIDLWASTEDDPGQSQLKKRGYAYLVRLYYNMPQRADASGKPMSREFKNLTFFVRHVGPRPTENHSLDRMDNGRGYCVDNVQWADKRTQSENRRTARYHTHLDRHLTDLELTELLQKKNCKVTVESIKKYRQRHMKAGKPPSEITASIFRKHGVSYQSSVDPVESADFPKAFRDKLAKAYPNLRTRHETRLDFSIRWLKREVGKLIEARNHSATASRQIPRLSDLISHYETEIERLEIERKRLHCERVENLIRDASITMPSTPPVVGPPPKLSEQEGAASAAPPSKTDTPNDVSRRNSEEVELYRGTTILDDVRFEPLRRNLTKFCKTAGIPERCLYQRMAAVPCSQHEMDFIIHLKRNLRNGNMGYMLVGQDNAENRLMGAVAALMRNEVDARFMTVNTMLEMHEARTLPKCTAIMIPNLYTEAGAKALPAWKVQIVHDILLQRLGAGKATFGYVESMEGLTKAYGKFFADHLKNHYTFIE